MTKTKFDWILGSTNSEGCGIDFRIYKNRTARQMKKEMADMIKNSIRIAKEEEYDQIDYATTKIKDIEEYPEDSPSELIGFINFYNSHENYTAIRMDKAETF